MSIARTILSQEIVRFQSVTLRYRVKTAKRIVEIIPPYDSAVLLIFSELNRILKFRRGHLQQTHKP